MPWTSADAQKKTKKADTPKEQALWAKVANATLARTNDDGRAIREANAVIGKTANKPKRRHAHLSNGVVRRRSFNAGD